MTKTTPHTWSSKFVFILATIGAAAGLGNLWRFPYMTYENGGAAFVVAYLICLFFFAKPLMMVEIAIAQKFKEEIVGTSGKIAGKFGKFVGWLAIMILVALGGYYAAIIGWGFDFFSASPTVAWGSDAEGFFHNEILGLTANANEVGNLSWKLVAGILATYLAVYFSIFKGLKSVSKVIQWTVPLPIAFLLILLLNATTLPGAIDGFQYFLLPDWSSLMSPKLWKDAITMSFFSTNVGIVLSFAYATYNNSKFDIVNSAWWIGLGDLLVSMTAGMAMFGTLGYMAHSTGQNVADVVSSGPTLAFVTLPTALAALPFGKGFFAVMFFGAILTLAVDSMFALIEAITMTARNQFGKLRNLSQPKLVAGLCVVFFAWSLMFATGNGLYRLDVIDHFFFGHLFYVAIVLQIILFTWVFGAEKIRQLVNSVSKYKLGSWFNVVIKWLAPAAFLYLYISTLPKELNEAYGGYPSDFLFRWGWLPLILSVVASVLLSLRKSK